MRHHASARLTHHARRVIVHRVIEDGWTITRAAQAMGVSRQTASKWVNRYRAGGDRALLNRSTRPACCPTRLSRRQESQILYLRVSRRWGPHRLSWELGVPRSTIYAVLRRSNLSRLRSLEPRRVHPRYEWPHPGDLVHLDTKKLGRVHPRGSKRFGGPRNQPGLGLNSVHIAVDDHSRLAYVEELPDERPVTTAGFLIRARAFYRSHGIEVARILTDNGNAYRSRFFAAVCSSIGIRHFRTKTYSPQTNGKAEAMVKILLNGWAYRQLYRSGEERVEALADFVDFYNHRRPHGGLNGARPIDRIRQ